MCGRRSRCRPTTRPSARSSSPRARSRSRPSSAAEPVEAVQDVALRVAELERADDRRDRELALAGERLRVDHEPRLALRGEHVLAVQVLVQEHLLALRRRELADVVQRGAASAPRRLPASLERPPPSARPRPRAGEAVAAASRAAAAVRRGRRARRPSQPERNVPGSQRSSSSACRSSSRASSRTAPSPSHALERVRLVLGLAVGKGELQHRRPSRRGAPRGRRGRRLRPGTPHPCVRPQAAAASARRVGTRASQSACVRPAPAIGTRRPGGSPATGAWRGSRAVAHGRSPPRSRSPRPAPGRGRCPTGRRSATGRSRLVPAIVSPICAAAAT